MVDVAIDSVSVFDIRANNGNGTCSGNNLKRSWTLRSKTELLTMVCPAVVVNILLDFCSGPF
eukprot:4416304-Amphidinium_carterae.1